MTFIKEDVVWFNVTANDTYFMETLNSNLKNLKVNQSIYARLEDYYV